MFQIKFYDSQELREETGENTLFKTNFVVTPFQQCWPEQTTLFTDKIPDNLSNNMIFYWVHNSLFVLFQTGNV